MKKIRTFRVIIYPCITCSVIILAVYWFLELNAVRYQKNNFTRKFISVVGKSRGSWNHNKTIVNISGIVGDTIYLQSSQAGTVIKSNATLTNFTQQKYFSSHEHSITSHCECNINSSGVFYFLGNKPAIYSGRLNGPLDQYFFPNAIFIRCCAISDNEVVYKGFDTGVRAGKALFFKGNILSKQIIADTDKSTLDTNGIIAGDGLLRYDRTSNRMIYLYFYKNKFLCLDTNFHLLYVGKTVDTVTHVATKYGAQMHNGATQFTNVSPRITVNNECCVANGLLFCNSYLKADNERPNDFTNNDVIDIYRIVDSKYIGSFYLPKVLGHHLLKFKIENDNLLVLYRDYIESFQFNCSVLNKNGAI